MPKVAPLRWFITGTSTGFGRALVEEAIRRGDLIAATVRSATDAAALRALDKDRIFPIELDITRKERIPAALAEGIEWLGGLDVLVNNAGAGMLGALEEVSDEEADTIFSVNFFGPFHLIRSALPYLREHGGQIVNISSAAGQVGAPGSACYSAAKFAITGLSEALQHELAPFDVNVMLVEPGTFRTAFSSGGSMRFAAREIAAYADTPAGIMRGMAARVAGRELGDPARGARAIADAVRADPPPRRLVLGSDALAAVQNKLKVMAAQIAALEHVSRSTDIEGGIAARVTADRKGD